MSDTETAGQEAPVNATTEWSELATETVESTDGEIVQNTEPEVVSSATVAETPSVAPQPVASDSPASTQSVEPQKQPTVSESPALASDNKLAAYEERLINAYAVPQELHADLLTQPEVVLPKLAAKVHMGVVNELAGMMQQALPHMITKVIEAQQAEQAAKQEFYTMFPELKPYEQQVLQAGAMYRRLNPTASKDVAMKAIGEMVMVAMGLQKQTQAQPPAQNFRPAQPGGAPMPAPKPETNIFSQLANELLNEDGV